VVDGREEITMKTKSTFGILAALPVIVLAGLAYTDSRATHGSPIGVELLTPLAEFTDDVAVQIRNGLYGRGTDVMNLTDASNIVVAKITIAPKAVFPWHTHPGPVVITVAQGDFVYVLAEDCVQRQYRGGEALIDAGFDNVHTAFNPSETEETVVYASFLGVPSGGPLTIPAAGPDPVLCPLPTP
jgi:hypothetical protein